MNEREVIELFERQPRTAHIYMLKNRGYHSYDVAMAAVKASGLNLRWVREEILDQALCNAAVSDDYRASLYVPRDFRSPETMQIAADRYRQEQCKPASERFEQHSDFSFLLYVVDEVKRENVETFVKRWQSEIKCVADLYSAAFFKKVHDRNPEQFQLGSKLHTFLQAHDVDDFMFLERGYILSEEKATGRVAYLSPRRHEALAFSM